MYFYFQIEEMLFNWKALWAHTIPKCAKDVYYFLTSHDAHSRITLG